MSDRSDKQGTFRTTSRQVESNKGMQPARVQYQPAPRPASSQIKPPPASPKR